MSFPSTRSSHTAFTTAAAGQTITITGSDALGGRYVVIDKIYTAAGTTNIGDRIEVLVKINNGGSTILDALGSVATTASGASVIDISFPAGLRCVTNQGDLAASLVTTIANDASFGGILTVGYHFERTRS